jgi:hypothetical protein
MYILDGMRKIRAVLPDGNVITGVEVFRQVYRAIGLGWVFELTSMPVIGTSPCTLRTHIESRFCNSHVVILLN